MIRSFMPNFIHSLDAANVHLLLHNLINNPIPVYTIHDCFASTPNNLLLVERRVKEAFIDIYFKEIGYLEKTHGDIINQINKSYEIIYIDDKEGRKCFVDLTSVNFITSQNYEDNMLDFYQINHDKFIEIPKLPEPFKNTQLTDFIKGLLKSKYFIG
jgi:DNA-directed RNA polymerase